MQVGISTIEVTDICKSFVKKNGQALDVLSNVSFEVPEAAVVCIVGPNGCGKTTLLRLIAGLIPPDRGIVRIMGKRVSGPDNHLAIVFQEFSLLPWRTVGANISLGLELRRIPEVERMRRVSEYGAMLRLEGFLDYFPHQLSAGMKQRVGLARALAVEPKILLMDEPFGAVDAISRERLQKEVLEIVKTTNKTMLFVTHSVDEALLLGNTVLMMSARPGRIERAFNIVLPEPRWKVNIHNDPRFGEYREQMWDLLSKQVKNHA